MPATFMLLENQSISGTSKTNCFSRFWHRSLQRMNHPTPRIKGGQIVTFFYFYFGFFYILCSSNIYAACIQFALKTIILSYWSWCSWCHHPLGKGTKKKRPVFVVFDYEGVRTPPPSPPLRSHMGKWNFLVKIFVVVDAIGLETDFTLETNRKRVKEKLLKRT